MPITWAQDIPEDDISETLAYLQLRDERREQARLANGTPVPKR